MVDNKSPKDRVVSGSGNVRLLFAILVAAGSIVFLGKNHPTMTYCRVLFFVVGKVLISSQG